MITWDFYETLNQNGCWKNGVDGRESDIESYMTVPDYDKIIEILRQESKNYTPDQWQEIYEDCKARAYLSPNNRILAGLIKRHIIEQLEQPE